MRRSISNIHSTRRVEPSAELVSSWGKLHPDNLPLIEIAKHRDEASELVNEVTFDDGPSS